MRKLLDRLFRRYYIVEYDAFEMEDAGFGGARHSPPNNPYQALYLCTKFGASARGVFRSYREANRYLWFCNSLPHEPIYPQHITRLPNDHPLVVSSIWR